MGVRVGGTCCSEGDCQKPRPQRPFPHSFGSACLVGPAVTLGWDFVKLFTSLRIFNSQVQYPDHDIYLNGCVETHRPFHFMSTKYPDTTFIIAFEIYHVNLISYKREQDT